MGKPEPDQPYKDGEEWIRAKAREQYLEWLNASDEERDKVMAMCLQVQGNLAEGRMHLLEKSSTYSRLRALAWSPGMELAPDFVKFPNRFVVSGDLSLQHIFDGSDPGEQADDLFTVVMEAPRVGELPKPNITTPANSFRNRWTRLGVAGDITYAVRDLVNFDLDGASLVVPLSLAFAAPTDSSQFDQAVVGGFVDHLITSQPKFVVHPLIGEDLTATVLSKGHRFCAETRSPIFAPPGRILICVGSEDPAIENRLRTVGFLLPKSLLKDEPEVRMVNKLPWEAFKQ